MCIRDSYVGKVNMDRNCPDFLTEGGAEESEKKTLRWLEETQGVYDHTRPILTPRFIPSCSDDLMRRLSRIRRQYGLPVQSHLSENPGEVQWVRELCPGTSCYGAAYDQFGLFGGEAKTVMAHCVYSGEEERALMKERGVFIAHCPESNENLSSGIAPVRRYLEEGQNMGLGSDVAGGTSESIFRAMAEAIQDVYKRQPWRMDIIISRGAGRRMISWNCVWKCL